MIDIHSHLLYQVDDGPLVLEDSLILLKQAEENGVTDMILTPHSWAFGGEKNQEWLTRRFLAFREEAKKSTVQLHLGMEHEVENYRRFVRRIDKEGIITLAKSRYILIEAMKLESVEDASELVYELSLRGLVPILAHPERMSCLRKDSSLVCAFREAGGLVQLTLEPCDPMATGTFHKVATRLLKEGEVDFLATDTHGLIRNCNALAEILGRLEGYIGKERTHRLVVENPQKVLQNQAIKNAVS